MGSTSLLTSNVFACISKGSRTSKNHVEAAGATLVFVTPPFYDDKRGKKPFAYDAVMDRYARLAVDAA